MKSLRIGLIGDFTPNKHTHLALNNSIDHCHANLEFPLEATWIPTDAIPEKLSDKFDGLWITPGSPYKNDGAVYKVIRWARENNFPLLGTCGGFQYMIIEYARNVLDISDAGHEESEPGAPHLVISKLSCSLKGQQEEVLITDRNSWLSKILRADKIAGFFNCNYGVNPAFQARLNQATMAFTAFSTQGEVRALEIKSHPFFKGTLFQPPLESTPEKPNPLIMDFFRMTYSFKK